MYQDKDGKLEYVETLGGALSARSRKRRPK